MNVKEFLSSELRQSLGLDREYGSNKLQPGERVKNRSRKRGRVELESAEAAKEAKISRGQQKRLERLQKEKEQKEKRESLYQELQDSALSSSQIALLRRSGTLGQKDTARQRLQRDLHRVQAGLELQEGSRLVVARPDAEVLKAEEALRVPQASSPTEAVTSSALSSGSSMPGVSAAPNSHLLAESSAGFTFSVGVPVQSQGTGTSRDPGDGAAKRPRVDIQLTSLDPSAGIGSGTSVPQNRASKTGGLGSLLMRASLQGVGLSLAAASDLGSSLLLEADEAGEFKELRRLREKNRTLAEKGELAVHNPKDLGKWKGKKSVMRMPKFATLGPGAQTDDATAGNGSSYDSEEEEEGSDSDSDDPIGEESSDDDEDDGDGDQNRDGEDAVGSISQPKKVKYVPGRSKRKVGLLPGTVAASSSRAPRFGAVAALKRPPLQQSQREKLPVYGMEQEIMEAINEDDVCIVAGETGSGKTTQVPQFLFENGFASTEVGGRPGVIAVTQPRRVAAVTTAQRVADELGTPCGPTGLVAYQVRFDTSGWGPSTSLKFLTDGLLLREAQSDLLLRKYSAVVLDEAHERNVNTDVLIGLLSRAIPLRRKLADEAAALWKSGLVERLGDEASAADEMRRLSSDGYPPGLPRPLKLIIMSATLRTEDFTMNRRLFASPPPVVTVKSRQFPVTMHFSRRTELVDYVDVAFKRVVQIHRKLPSGGVLVFLTGKQDVKELVTKLRSELGRRSKRGIAARDLAEGDRQLATKLGGAAGLHDTVADAEDEAGVDFDLDDSDDEHDWNAVPAMEGKGSKAAAQLQQDAASDDQGSASTEADSESSSSSDSESESNSSSDDSDENSDEEEGEGATKVAQGAGESAASAEIESTVKVLPLFAALPRDQQLRIFAPSQPGERLIVVATNVAETSITIPGIRYVVDAGRQKRKVFTDRGGVARFEVDWISKASSDQRSGRAGRIGPGHCYRLYSSAVYQDKFPQFEEPQVLRTPIDALVMQLKSIGIASVPRFPFPSPPSATTLREAMKHLFAIGAIRPELPDSGEERKLVIAKARAGLQAREQSRIAAELAENRKALRIAEGASSSEEEEDDMSEGDDIPGQGKSRSVARAEELKTDAIKARRQARKLADSLPEAALLADAAIGETVTSLGARVAALPVAPALAKMLVLAQMSGPRMVQLCCALVAAMTVQEVLDLPWLGAGTSDDAGSGEGGSSKGTGADSQSTGDDEQADVAAAGFAGLAAPSMRSSRGGGRASNGRGDVEEWGMGGDDDSDAADDWGAGAISIGDTVDVAQSRREQSKLAKEKAAEKVEQQQRKAMLAQARAAFESIRHGDSDPLTLLRIVGAHAYASYSDATDATGQSAAMSAKAQWKPSARKSKQWCIAMHAREKQLQEVHLLRRQLMGLLLSPGVETGAEAESFVGDGGESDAAASLGAGGGGADETEDAGVGELARGMQHMDSESKHAVSRRDGNGAPSSGAGASHASAPFAVPSPLLAPPTPAEEDALAQIVCAGYIDRVARRAQPAELRQMGLRPPTGATPGHRVPYVSASLEHRDALYVHRSSAVCASAAASMPEWLVFGELQKGGLGGRTFMKQVTRITSDWLPRLARGTPLCVMGEPLPAPAPAFDKKTGVVHCYRAPTFGEQGWKLPALKSRALPSPASATVFGRALLDGAACKQLRPLMARLALPSALLDEGSAQSRSVALLGALASPPSAARARISTLSSHGESLLSPMVDSRASLSECWKSEPTFLMAELREWLPEELRPRLDAKWAGAVQRFLAKEA